MINKKLNDYHSIAIVNDLIFDKFNESSNINTVSTSIINDNVSALSIDMSTLMENDLTEENDSTTKSDLVDSATSRLRRENSALAKGGAGRLWSKACF